MTSPVELATRVLGIACAAGTARGLACGRAFTGMLYGVSPLDPRPVAGGIAIVGAVGLLAALIPATRAVLTQPVRTLREG